MPAGSTWRASPLMSTPRRLVVVDDDSKVRLLLERAFRVPEFETHVFPTGAAALQHMAELRPDCVVSDILMPDMDGENLLRAVRTVPGLPGPPPPHPPPPPRNAAAHGPAAPPPRATAGRAPGRPPAGPARRGTA